MNLGWSAKTLGDTCVMYQPKTITAKEMVGDGPYPVFGANGIIGQHNEFNHERPQLLVTCRGATCGAVNVSLPKSWITGNAMVVRPKDNRIDLRYLEYVFRGGIDWNVAITGAAQPQITRANLVPLTIQFPNSLEEQRQIVEMLDEAFTGISTATANAQKNLTNTRALFECALENLLASCSVQRMALKDVCSFENGDRGENYPGRAAFVEAGVPFINAGHLTRDGVDIASMNFIPPDRFARLGNGKVRLGDILFCLRGSLGKFAINRQFDKGAIASSLIIVRTGSKVTTDYVATYFSSQLCAAMVKKYANGTAQPNLAGKSLGQFEIPVPSLAEQTRIVERLAEVRTGVDNLEASYEAKLRALTELKQSLLQKAFAGELI